METINVETLLNECSYPCISIILPTDALSQLRQLVAEAESMMRRMDVPEETIKSIVRELSTVDSSSLENGACGLGIFVSPQIAGVISFPFKVNKRICVDQMFDTEYLMQLLEYQTVPAS